MKLTKLKRKAIVLPKEVCLECQRYIGNCIAGCSGTNRFRVSHSFRPPKVGSSKWKLIEKLIRKNIYEGKEYPTQVQGSASFSRNTFRRRCNNIPKTLHERGYLETRLKQG